MGERCIRRTRGLITFTLCDEGEQVAVEAVDARAGRIAGAKFERFAEDGRAMLRVSSINTDRGVRRSGVGTAIYELALERACEEKRQLVSDDHRSEWAEAFWRKQRRKGRATCIQSNAKGRSGRNYNEGPRASLQQDVRDACTRKYTNKRKVESCVKKGLRDATRSLPRPQRNAADGLTYWPCKRFGIKRNLCKSADRSLAGAVEPRTRKQKQVKG